jgi:hypothetical protein
VERPVVIAKMATHDGTLTILGGGPELRYSIAGADGSMVAERLSEGELRSTHPELYRLVTWGVAQNGTYVDATLTRPHAEPRSASGIR